MTLTDDEMMSNYGKKITLSIDILDIYRLDISCDYITKALASKVSTTYRNKNKKCSLASLDLKVNSMLLESINASFTSPKSYKPTYNGTDTASFEPFNCDNEKYQLRKYPHFASLKPGGHWYPKLSRFAPCQRDDIENIVFIVPFSRSRINNLKLFLINMHDYLQTVKYKFSYRIVVAEQDMNVNNLFNKGRLINTAVRYVLKNLENIDCLIVHDVDLIPSDDPEFILREKGDYRCRQMPWHMSNEVYSMKKKESRIYNPFLTGGILSLRPGHFVAANGFSNMYFGWGAEDDDFTLRMFTSNLCIMRSKVEIETGVAPFTMLEHLPAKENSVRFKQLANSLRFKQYDGISNIESLTDIKSINYYLTFTHLFINVFKS